MTEKKPLRIPGSHIDLLTSNYSATMTTVRHSDGLLTTNPVTAHWIDNTVKISTLKSRMKYKNIVADNRVTVCVVSPTDRMHYIEIRGRASLEDDLDRRFHDSMFEKTVGSPPPEDMDPAGAQRVVITVHPEQISHPTLYGGRFDGKKQSDH